MESEFCKVNKAQENHSRQRGWCIWKGMAVGKSQDWPIIQAVKLMIYWSSKTLKYSMSLDYTHWFHPCFFFLSTKNKGFLFTTTLEQPNRFWLFLPTTSALACILVITTWKTSCWNWPIRVTRKMTSGS